MRTPLPRRPRALLLPAIIVASLAASACDIVTADFKSRETAEWRKTYQLAPGGRVEVANVNGKIDVTGSSGNTVEIIAEKIARGATPEDAKNALGRVEIREEVGAALVKVETRVDRGGGIFRQGGVEVRYTVKVPASAEVRFTTTNGGIELAGLDGRVTAETTNGAIRARGLSGPVEASTTNGGVDVDLARVSEPGVKLECTNGGIKLRLPADAKATLSASITNGGIGVDDLDGMRLDKSESSRRRLEARLNGGGPSIRLSGTNGGIHIGAR